MRTLNKYIDSVVNKVLKESLEERADKIIGKLNTKINETDDMDGFEEIDLNEGETCEQCGGSMNEGKCSECGSEMENMYEGTKKLSKGQKYISKQAKPTDKIDAKDFEKLRMKKHKSKKHQTDEEMEEGNAFTGALARAKKLGDDEFEVEGKKYQVKESIRLTEDEIIDLIEKIVKEEKDNIRKQSNHPGVSTTKKNLDNSKKENESYIKSVTEKMKKYLKDGSKGDFDLEPKIFPKGNGELGEMSKKTYKATKEVDEYIENFAGAGLENISYDEIHPNESKMDEYLEGSSKAGNNPKWANAVETDVNKRRNKIRKTNLLSVLKKKESYNRQPQPVYDYKKDNEKEKDVARIFQALESKEEKKEKLLKEDIQKMNDLLVYNKKTQ
jgi:hypothetical protein